MQWMVIEDAGKNLRGVGCYLYLCGLGLALFVLHASALRSVLCALRGFSCTLNDNLLCIFYQQAEPSMSSTYTDVELSDRAPGDDSDTSCTSMAGAKP